MTPADRVVVPLETEQARVTDYGEGKVVVDETALNELLRLHAESYSALLVENERLEDEVHHHESERRRLHGLLAQGIALRERVEGVKAACEDHATRRNYMSDETAWREAARLLTSALEGK